MTNGKGAHQYFSCDCCGLEGSFDLSEGHCAVCGDGEICAGCSHMCSVCEREICADHILATPFAGVLHTATHTCVECDALGFGKVAA